LDIHKTLFEEICLFAPYAVIKSTAGIDLIKIRQVKKSSSVWKICFITIERVIGKARFVLS